MASDKQTMYCILSIIANKKNSLKVELLISEQKYLVWIREVFSTSFVILFVSYWPRFCYKFILRKFTAIIYKGAATHELFNMKAVLELCFAINEKSQTVAGTHNI